MVHKSNRNQLDNTLYKDNHEFLLRHKHGSASTTSLENDYVRSTEAQLLLIKPQSVVQPLHIEVEQIRSSGHHGRNSLSTELLWLEIVHPLQTME